MKIGIIGAMAAEVEALRSELARTSAAKGEAVKKVQRAGMEFCEGTIGRTDVVVVQSGVGKVNAGICVQILADVFNVTHIINTGVAGSLNNELGIGDIVVSTDAVYHDVDATVFGYAPGEVPQLGVAAFAADEELRALATTAVAAAAPDIKVLEGRVASGDQFICTPEQKAHIKETFDPFCTEMEGAAIAQAAHLNGLPFVIIRAISDKADGSDIVDYPVFEAKAAGDCAKIVIRMLS